MLKKLPLLVLIIFLFGCHDFDPMEDVMITINYDLFETFVSFRFVDAETGDLIGAKDMSSVTASFKGDDAAAVLTQVGEHPEAINSVFGLISITLNPFEPYLPTEDQPVKFTISASAAGYADADFSVSIADTGYFTYSVIMPREGYKPSEPSSFIVKLGILEDGQLEQGFEVISPYNQTQIQFPDGVEFLNEGNNAITGEITMEINNYQDFDQTRLSEKKILNIFEKGDLRKAVINPLALAEINIYNSEGDKVRHFTGTNLPEWVFELNKEDENFAAPEVWSFNTEKDAWVSEGVAVVQKEDSTFHGSVSLSHLTFFAAGTESDTREINGSIDIHFTKAFIADEFNGELLVISQQSGETIHRIPMNIAQKTFDFSFFVPADDDLSLRIRASASDFEFSSDPAAITILSDQETFHHEINITPLKCPFSGTVNVHLSTTFPYYPIPARLRIRNASSGSSIKTLNINITENASDYPFFIMLPDGIPVECSLEPRALANDFIIPDGSVHFNSSCQNNQILSYNLSSSTCMMNGTFGFRCSDESSEDNVQIRILVSRTSDNRIIHNKIINLTNTNTNYNFNLPVPQNTAVNISFESVNSINPLAFSPATLSFDNPCNASLDQTIEYSSTLIKLSGIIIFTKDQDITASTLPIKLAYLDWKTEKVMKEFNYNLDLSEPQIDFSAFVEDAPLFIRVTRNDPNGLFVTDPYLLRVPDPSNPPAEWHVNLIKTEKKMIHASLLVVCPAGEINPTVQGYFRIPGEEWKELFIVAGNLLILAEMHATYEVGMILDNKMTDSTFTVTSQNIEMTFELDPDDCDKMGWGK